MMPLPDEMRRAQAILKQYNRELTEATLHALEACKAAGMSTTATPSVVLGMLAQNMMEMYATLFEAAETAPPEVGIDRQRMITAILMAGRLTESLLRPVLLSNNPAIAVNATKARCSDEVREWLQPKGGDHDR